MVREAEVELIAERWGTKTWEREREMSALSTGKKQAEGDGHGEMMDGQVQEDSAAIA